MSTRKNVIRSLAAKIFLLTFSVAGSPWVASEAIAAPAPQHDAVSCEARPVQAQSASANEINGRSDWNVDYPSQLAPQTVSATCDGQPTTSVAMVTDTSTLDQ